VEDWLIGVPGVGLMDEFVNVGEVKEPAKKTNQIEIKSIKIKKCS
jgi:hypothetical protein